MRGQWRRQAGHDRLKPVLLSGRMPWICVKLLTEEAVGGRRLLPPPSNTTKAGCWQMRGRRRRQTGHDRLKPVPILFGTAVAVSLPPGGGRLRVPQRLPAIPGHPHPACGRPLPEGEARWAGSQLPGACRGRAGKTAARGGWVSTWGWGVQGKAVVWRGRSRTP